MPLHFVRGALRATQAIHITSPKYKYRGIKWSEPLIDSSRPINEVELTGLVFKLVGGCELGKLVYMRANRPVQT